MFLLVLMAVATAAAGGAISSNDHDSVYYSSYCRKYSCVLEDRGFSHTDGVDFGQFKYRLKDGSVLIQHRYVPFDPSEHYSSNYAVAVLTLELSKKLTPKQLGRRLLELVNYGTGSSFTRFRFDFAHKCVRPTPPPNAYPWNGPYGETYTFEIQKQKFELTCVWSRENWAFYLHRGIIFPTFTQEVFQ